MNRFTGTIICMMTGMLAMAQQVYELDMPVKEKTIYSGHLKLGGNNPSGEPAHDIAVTLTLDVGYIIAQADIATLEYAVHLGNLTESKRR